MEGLVNGVVSGVARALNSPANFYGYTNCSTGCDAINETIVYTNILNTKVADLNAEVYGINSGDCAWVLGATALVFLIAIPGLLLYFAGMMQSKNLLSLTLQVYSTIGVVTFTWLALGYSLAFAPAQGEFKGTKGNEFYGDGSRLWLRGMKLDTVNSLAPTIPEALFCVYQLMFAIITAILVIGSFADRMKFEATIVFIFFWIILVYCPIAHVNFTTDGFLVELGAVDFAGGNVVHVSSGMAGLMAAFIVGNRRGYIPASDSLPPHNILLTVMGASLMWVGWLGFNAGSAYSSGERASYAALATQICASTSSLMWLSVETIIKKKPSVIGLVNGAISGLVVITPAAGFVDMNGAFWMGFFGGPLCYFGSQFKHTIFGVDDALDAFGIHAWGGMIGGICVGFFAMDAVSEEPAAIDGVYSGSTRHGGHLLAYQIAAVLFSVVYAGFGSFVILKVMDMIMGLRADGDLIREEQGLDASLHDDALPAKEAELENDVPPPLAEPATQA